MELRVLSLIIAVSGLGILIAFLFKSPISVKSLDGLSVGEIVSISGIVDTERKFGNGKLLIVEDIPVFCECSGKYAGLNVIIEGIIERFPDDLRIRAFSIKILD